MKQIKKIISSSVATSLAAQNPDMHCMHNADHPHSHTFLYSTQPWKFFSLFSQLQMSNLEMVLVLHSYRIHIGFYIKNVIAYTYL